MYLALITIFALVNTSVLSSVKEFTTYNLVSHRGCVYQGGYLLESCEQQGVQSEKDCEKACTSVDECLGYQYSMNELRCFLFPSKSTFTSCPNGWQHEHGTNSVMAETIQDIVGSKDGKQSDCNIKIYLGYLCRDQFFCNEVTTEVCSRFP